MLDIAGGILIALLLMAGLTVGIRFMVPQPEHELAFREPWWRLLGFLIFAAAAVLIFWILAVRPGVVPCSPGVAEKLPAWACPSMPSR